MQPPTSKPTYPSKKKKGALTSRERTRLRKQKIHQFLPCFFDVPAADVQEILKISHHTLDPLRRSLGLQKWPFMDVARNRFCMSADEIAALRSSMMAVADPEMYQILVQMEEKAKECKEFVKLQASHRLLHNRWRRTRKTKPEPEEGGEPAEKKPTPTKTEQLDRLLTANLQLVGEGPSLETLMIDDAMLPGDTEFWHEISQILSSPPGHPCKQDDVTRQNCKVEDDETSHPCKMEEESEPYYYPFSAAEPNEPCPVHSQLCF